MSANIHKLVEKKPGEYYTLVGYTTCEVVMDFNSDIVDILTCIDCGGNIEYLEKSNKLRCKSCQREYDIINGIPMMGGIDDRVDDPEAYK